VVSGVKVEGAKFEIVRLWCSFISLEQRQTRVSASCVPDISNPYKLLFLIQNLELSNYSTNWNLFTIRFMLLNIFPLIFFCLALTNIKAKRTYYLWHNLPLGVNPYYCTSQETMLFKTSELRPMQFLKKLAE